MAVDLGLGDITYAVVNRHNQIVQFGGHPCVFMSENEAITAAEVLNRPYSDSSHSSSSHLGPCRVVRIQLVESETEDEPST